jgi:hypothetical protein
MDRLPLHPKIARSVFRKVPPASVAKNSHTPGKRRYAHDFHRDFGHRDTDGQLRRLTDGDVLKHQASW